MFAYNDVKLPSGPPATRVLELLPAKSGEPIECNLKIVNLQGNRADLEYEAISYACGDSTQRSAIQCNGQTISVNANLVVALNYLRLQSSSRLLWADAICINEDDVEERNNQVDLMPRIYLLAQEVLAWLGEEADCSSKAISVLKKLSTLESDYDVLPFKPDIMMDEWEHTRSFAAYTAGPKWQPETQEFTVLGVFAATHIGLLIQRPWFQRAWVVQEVGFAKKVTFFCGRDTIDIDTMLHGLTAARLSGIAEMNYQYWLSLGNVAYLRSNLDRHIPGFAILQSFRSRHATDPKDKVFALLSLSTLLSTGSPDSTRNKDELFMSDRRSIKADYRLETGDIYMQVARDALHIDQNLYPEEQKRQLDYLSIPHQQTILSLPSWVVDWSTANSSMIAFPSVGVGTKHSAGGVGSPSVRVTGKTLILSGIIIDKIRDLAPPFPHAVTDWDVYQCFPTHRHLFWDLPKRILYISKMWAEKAADSGSVAAQWDKIAAPFSDEIYCQCLHACTFTEEAHPDLMQGFKSWKHCRWPTRFLLTVGLLQVSVILHVVALFEHILRTIEKQITGRTQPRFVFTAGRSLGRTQDGGLGLFPGEAKPGDTIAVVQGGPRPFILRPAATEGTWTLVGDAFIYGIMDGQAFDDVKCEEIFII